MPWNPEVYDQFKNIRYKPFFDLAGLIVGDGLQHCVDIGCGTGEQTKMLSDKFEHASFLGIDPSVEMLEKSQQFIKANLIFEQSTVEEFISNKKGKQKFDLVFSNAALQWSDHHEMLFPELIALLNENGQFAIQMPVQKENLLNQLLLELVQEQPFTGYLNGWTRESPLLSIDHYAQIMFENGLKDIQVIQKVYPIIASNTQTLFDFISGSALIPYIEKMPTERQEMFITEYRIRIEKAFKKYPALYAFKRLLLYGVKS